MIAGPSFSRWTSIAIHEPDPGVAVEQGRGLHRQAVGGRPTEPGAASQRAASRDERASSGGAASGATARGVAVGSGRRTRTPS